MITLCPKRLILLGLFLVLLGFVLPFLMVLHAMDTTFFLSFVSWGSTSIGLILGVIGASQYTRSHRN